MDVAIIGTGNIGCDLLVKIMRSEYLNCTLITGRRLNSPGSNFAVERHVKVSDLSIREIQNHPDICRIVFDATDAASHKYNAPILKKLGKFVIDLTPAKVGTMCIPVINLDDALTDDNVNLVTCGGQTAVPIAHAITQVHPNTRYIELVSTIASKSAGIGTRNNIDEFTQTTKEALSHFTGVKETKAIIILNPAFPPIKMRTTIYALIDNPDISAIRNNVINMTERVKAYVPGYNLITEPIYENGRLITTIEVTGMGDYLPSYAGNLDIITCAAIEIAEAYAKKSEGIYLYEKVENF